MNRLIKHLAQVIPNSKYFDLINTWLNDEKMFETKFYEKSTQMNYFLMKEKKPNPFRVTYYLCLIIHSVTQSNLSIITLKKNI